MMMERVDRLWDYFRVDDRVKAQMEQNKFTFLFESAMRLLQYVIRCTRRVHLQPKDNNGTRIAALSKR
jgi:hypothetical protein